MDCVAILVCAQLIYIKDLSLVHWSYSTAYEALSILNAKIFFYSNSVICILVYFYLLRQQTCLVLLFAMGTIIQLCCRLFFAYYFYFYLNLANLIGLLLAIFYLYALWQQIDTRSTFALPQFCTDAVISDDDDDEQIIRQQRQQKQTSSSSSRKTRKNQKSYI